MPIKDRPTYESLGSYIRRYPVSEDLAFSDRYDKLLIWLNDYAHRGSESEQEPD